MNRLADILKTFGELLSYPNDRTMPTTEWLYCMIKDDLPEAASRVSEFGLWSEQTNQGDWEEAYTQTFDNSPKCALEVGWHLFGEEYARGMFLVRMREEMRRFRIVESGELPDHLVHVLQIVAAMPANEAERFATACVLPGVKKLRDGVAAVSTPYEAIVVALVEVLEHIWPGVGEHSGAGENTWERSGDPLHAFPVADVIPNCNGCEGQMELVPLTGGSSHPLSDKSQAQIPEVDK
ncbi:MAG: molecular chaperone TorD family protein [Pirellulales bacterium]|nr:molecular chaperone TorD family protein [Pirellulales bacterium]